MSVQKTESANKSSREFVGRGWINTVQKEGKAHGMQFINVRFDNGVQAIADLDKKGVVMQLWPNKKREGKQDADYRVSLVTPQTA